MTNIIKSLTDLNDPTALKIVIRPVPRPAGAESLDSSELYNSVVVNNIADARDPYSTGIVGYLQALVSGQESAAAILSAIQEFEPGNSFLSGIHSMLNDVVQVPPQGSSWIRVGGTIANGTLSTLPVGTTGYNPDGTTTMLTVDADGYTYGPSSTTLFAPDHPTTFAVQDVPMLRGSMVKTMHSGQGDVNLMFTLPFKVAEDETVQPVG